MSCQLDVTLLCYLKYGYVFVLDVLLTVEHVKDVLKIEVQKADALLLSVSRYLLKEMKVMHDSCFAMNIYSVLLLSNYF